MKRICVFAGSRMGTLEAHQASAVKLGQALAREGLELVYGGASVGLMTLVADAVLQAGGKVIGVIPEFLVHKEIAHRNLTELHIVKTMHERKALMAHLSDAFVALPGGFGTFEEYCEAITWTQLKVHNLPCGLLNVEGFYDPLLEQFARASQHGFLRPEHHALVLSHHDPEELLHLLRLNQPSERFSTALGAD